MQSWDTPSQFLIIKEDFSGVQSHLNLEQRVSINNKYSCQPELETTLTDSNQRPVIEQLHAFDRSATAAPGPLACVQIPTS